MVTGRRGLWLLWVVACGSGGAGACGVLWAAFASVLPLLPHNALLWFCGFVAAVVLGLALFGLLQWLVLRPAVGGLPWIRASAGAGSLGIAIAVLGMPTLAAIAGGGPAPLLLALPLGLAGLVLGAAQAGVLRTVKEDTRVWITASGLGGVVLGGCVAAVDAWALELIALRFVVGCLAYGAITSGAVQALRYSDGGCRTGAQN